MTTINATTSAAGTTTVSGIVSGLDTTALINAQINAAGIPQTLLKAQLVTANSLLTDLQTTNASFSSLGTLASADTRASTYQVFTTASSSPSVTVTTTTQASAGSISLSVDAVAKAQVGVSAQLSAFTTVPTFTIVGSDGTKTEVTPVTGSLADVADAVSKSGAGVSAISIASGKDPSTGASLYRLQFTSTSTGAASAFSIYQGTAADVDAGTATDLLAAPGAASISTAADANVRLWAGTSAEQTITSSSNTFKELLPGVAVTISQVETSPVAISVARDVASNTATANTLVTTVNTLLQAIATKSAVSSSTDSTGNVTVSAGSFTGDGLMRAASTALFTSVAAPVNGVSPSTLGIDINQDGTITFDSSVFQAALTADPAGTQSMLQTIAGRVATQATLQSDSSTGLLTSRVLGETGLISDLQKHISDWDVQLAAQRDTLTTQYTAMESQLSALKSQAAWLTQQFSSSTNSTGSSSS